MEESSHQPAGFCPYCDYATDPGKCTECGQEVTQANICTSPRRQRVKRVVRRIFKTLLIAAVLGGVGYGIYHETRPHRIVRYYSTDYLLERDLQSPNDNYFDWRSDSNIYYELLRRTESKRLTQKQFDDWLRLYTEAYAPDIDIPSPYPVGFKLELAGRLRSCHLPLRSFPPLPPKFPGSWTYTHERDELLINSKMVTTREFQSELNPAILGVAIATYEGPRVAIDHAYDLKPGNHLIEIRRRIRFEQHTEHKAANSWESHYLPTTITYTSRKDVEVVNSDAASLTKGLFDARDVEILKTKIKFNDYSSIREYSHRRSLAFPVVAGYCLIYPNTTNDVDTEPCVYRIPQDNCRVKNIINDCIADADDGRATFVPDADLAFDAGHGWYFNGVIEWHNIKIVNGMPLFGTPDVIRPYDTDEFDVESMLSKSED